MKVIFSLSNYLNDYRKEKECAQEGDKKTKTPFLSIAEAKCHLTALYTSFLLINFLYMKRRRHDSTLFYVQTICFVIILKFHLVKYEEHEKEESR